MTTAASIGYLLRIGEPMTSNKNLKPLPRQGLDSEQILDALEELRLGDVHWRQGRALSSATHDDAELEELCTEAYLSYFTEDGCSPSSFPSLKQMETDVVSMTADLLGGDQGVVGNITSSASESSFLAVKTARNWARANRPKLSHPEVVLSQSAHPAFVQACRDLDVKPVIVPFDTYDFRVDVKAATKAMSERTVMVVGSAPTLAHGAIDPIPELAKLASSQGALCHVDASIGGLFLPFLASLDEPVSPFDLTVDGVTSISADIHRYGAAARDTSILLYRDRELRRHQYFVSIDWPGGVYATPTSSGTKPGGSIAAAWAVMHKLGFDGYRDMVGNIMATTRLLQRGIASIEGLEVLGQPQMSVMAVGSSRHNVYELADHLSGRGWLVERQIDPPSLNITVGSVHASAVNEFLEDLRRAADDTTQEPVERLIDRTRGFLIKGATRVLPKKIFNRVTTFAGDVLGLSTNELTISSIPVRGISPAMAHGGDIEEAAFNTLDDLYHLDLTHIESPENEEPESSPPPESPEDNEVAEDDPE